MPRDLARIRDNMEIKFEMQHWKNTITFRDYSNKAWVNRNIFIKMMTMIDKNSATLKDSYVIVDNCSAHILDSETLDSFSKIKIIYLPPNVTSVFQPCDQKLFYALKRRYRSLLALKKANSITEAYQDLLLSVNELGAVSDEHNAKMKGYLQATLKTKTNNVEMLDLLKQAYAQITRKSIRNCWRDAQLLHPRQTNVLLSLDENEADQNQVDTSNDPIEAPSRLALGFTNFLEMDLDSLDEVETAVRDELDDLQVSVATIAISAINGASTAEVQLEALSDNDIEVEVVVPPLTQHQVNILKELAQFLELNEEDQELQLRIRHKIDDWEAILSRQQRQSNVASFFRSYTNDLED